MEERKFHNGKENFSMKKNKHGLLYDINGCGQRAITDS